MTNQEKALVDWYREEFKSENECGFGEMRPFAPKSSGSHGMFEVVRN